LTKLKKVSQRGLLAAAIMLPLILVFYSLPDAQAADPMIPCGGDIDATINNTTLYPRNTPQRFVLTADCPSPFTASTTIVPSDGDEVVCAKEPTFEQLTPGTDSTAAFDPTTYCTVAGPGVENVFRPIGQGGTTATVRFEGITIMGGKFTGSSGSGAAIAEGSMTNDSYHYGIEVRDNGAAGILTAKGTFERVEFTNNTTDLSALSFIAAGIKARNEIEVKNSYIHGTQGNGLWCDGGCVEASNTLPGFYVHHNLVVDNWRAGIRYENSTNAARIENNEVHGNSDKLNRGGVSVHDAQDALVQNNVFGPKTIAGVTYEANALAAVRATDSGRSGRPNLNNVDIFNNVLNGERIMGCELPDEVVDCTP
jgi:Right handed beta helix region